MDDELRNMLYRLDNGNENDLRKRLASLERLTGSLQDNSQDPNTYQGVDDYGILRTVTDNVDLQRNIGTASGLEINWWLPMTLADDDIDDVRCQVFQTISGIKYLYVGGTFTRIGGVSASNIARYNFSTRQWEAVNGGVNLSVYVITFSPGGVLYIGGIFTDAGGDTAADRIAKDNSGSWVNVNGGVNAAVNAIAFSSGGTLYIGGAFTSAGGDGSANNIAKDNAGSWVNVNGGVSLPVFTMAFSPGGTLYIGGGFTNAGGDANADYIAKDNAGSWVNVNGGVSDPVRIISFSPDGTLYIGGWFTDAGGDADADYIAKDNAGTWVNVMGGLNGAVYFMAFAGGLLYICGLFTDAGGDTTADRIAFFDGTSWRALSNLGGLSGLGGYVYSVVVDALNNTVYAAGDFGTAGSIQTKSIAAFVRPLADAIDMIAGLFEQYQAWSGVTNGDSHDHIGGDGAAITESAITLADNTTNNASTTAHGFAAKAVAPAADLLNVLGITNGETVWSPKTLGSWASWTPTFTNLTVGNGTLDCKYVKIGKLVIATIHLTFGSTSSISGAVTCTLPDDAMNTLTNIVLGDALYNKSGVSLHPGTVLQSSTTAIAFRVSTVSGSNVVATTLSSTVPFTWASGDRLTATFMYELA